MILCNFKKTGHVHLIKNYISLNNCVDFVPGIHLLSVCMYK